MGNNVVRLDVNEKTVTIDDTEYKLTPGLLVLITRKHPQPTQYNSNDYKVYKLLRPRLNHSRIGQVKLLDRMLHGNGSLCSRKRLYLEKG